jgi:hypothetical protein
MALFVFSNTLELTPSSGHPQEREPTATAEASPTTVKH